MMMADYSVSAVTGSAVDVTGLTQELGRISDNLEFCSMLLVVLVVLGFHGLLLRLIKKGGIK